MVGSADPTPLPAAPAGLPLLPPRPREAHKGSMGRVLLICGARGMAGAAVLSATAALRGGAGYAVLAVPGALSPEMAASRPEAVLHLCGGGRRHFIAEDVEDLGEELERAQAVVIGPGIGTDPETGAFFEGLLELRLRGSHRATWLLDADALNLLAARPLAADSWSAVAPLLLTPHPGEAARLLDWADSGAIQADRQGALQELVNRSGATVLLKGANTLIGAPGRTPWVNQSGNPGMATAGSGDVLSGLLGALLARGLDAWDAARLGAWLHGRAGDLAANEKGEDSVIAGDLNDYLPQAMMALSSRC